MIAVCVYCPRRHVKGIKRPLLSFAVTHGMCATAAARENAKLDAREARERAAQGAARA